MGYLCPVCAAPFGGGEPLADHLAVSAILHGGDHEAWLDETVENWDSISRADLGDRVVEYAEETDDHEHIGDHNPSTPPAPSHSEPEPASGLPNGIDAPDAVDGDGTLDADAQAILREARELTQEMQGDNRSESDDERNKS